LPEPVRQQRPRTGEQTPDGFVARSLFEELVMGIVLLVLLLALIFGGLGFAVHALWIIAAVILAAWVIGFAMRSGESARWYRW